MSDLESLQARLHYTFKNASLLEEALTAAGAAVSSREVNGLVSGNKRLALIGDAVLRLSVLDEWYLGGASTGNEEAGHEMVKDVGTNDRLQDVAKDWNLSAWLKENPCQAGQEPGARSHRQSRRSSMLSGWIVCDRNLDEVQDVIKLLQG
ncbi:RNase [Paraphaeosphaeria sporulosa]